MKYIVVLVVILLLNLPLTVFGQVDEICLTVPTDPNAHDDEQPRLVGVSMHLALNEFEQQDDEKLLSVQCPLNDDVNREEVDALRAENEALRANNEALQADLVALHADAVALQVENQSLREELRLALSGVSPINCIPRRQCDIEKVQLHAEMAAIEAACEAEIHYLEEHVAATQVGLQECHARLAAMEAACEPIQASCHISFSEAPPPGCQPYIDAYENCGRR